MTRNERGEVVGPPVSAVGAVKGILLVALALFLILGLGIGGCAGIKSFQRSQARANANNQVSITHILIQKARQQAQINYAEIQATKAEAEKRYQEAVGIRRAQDEVSKTLTPLYIQHEAIQALQAVATSGRNNTVVYVPSGQNGVPIVTAQAGTGK